MRPTVARPTEDGQYEIVGPRGCVLALLIAAAVGTCFALGLVLYLMGVK